METKLLYDLHAEYAEWNNRLKFYRDEWQILNNRLAEVAEKNNAFEVRAEIEHFQNQLILHDEQLDILTHKLNEAGKKIEENIRQNPTASDHRKMSEEAGLREEVQAFEQIFGDLRSSMSRFFSKWI